MVIDIVTSGCIAAFTFAGGLIVPAFAWLDARKDAEFWRDQATWLDMALTESGKRNQSLAETSARAFTERNEAYRQLAAEVADDQPRDPKTGRMLPKATPLAKPLERAFKDGVEL